MDALELLEKAYRNLDINLLKEAIRLGADINHTDEYGETLFETMVYEVGQGMESDPDKYSEEDLFKFTDALIENGLDLNHYADDGVETWSTYTIAAKWSNSLKYLEYLLQKGMNPNLITDKDNYSHWEDIDGDIFAEECCGCFSFASYLYNASRLSVAYGAKPMILLRREGTPDVIALQDIAMNLDVPGLESLSPEENLDNGLSAWCTYYSRFIYGYDFYYNPDKYQERVIEALDCIIAKIGVGQIDNDCIYDCVTGQLVQVMRYLLRKGANPNVNCFTSSYSYVKSSALFELQHRYDYYDRNKARQMYGLLIQYGAE